MTKRARRAAPPYWHRWPAWLQVAVDAHMESAGVRFDQAYRDLGIALAQDVARRATATGRIQTGDWSVVLRRWDANGRVVRPGGRVANVTLWLGGLMTWRSGGDQPRSQRFEIEVDPAQPDDHDLHTFEDEFSDEDEVAAYDLLREAVRQAVDEAFGAAGAARGVRRNPARSAARANPPAFWREWPAWMQVQIDAALERDGRIDDALAGFRTELARHLNAEWKCPRLVLSPVFVDERWRVYSSEKDKGRTLRVEANLEVVSPDNVLTDRFAWVVAVVRPDDWRSFELKLESGTRGELRRSGISVDQVRACLEAVLEGFFAGAPPRGNPARRRRRSR
jgi:hypothetical protein